MNKILERRTNISKSALLEMVEYYTQEYWTNTEEFRLYNQLVLQFASDVYDVCDFRYRGLSDKAIDMFRKYADKYYTAYFEGSYVKS